MPLFFNSWDLPRTHAQRVLFARACLFLFAVAVPLVCSPARTQTTSPAQTSPVDPANSNIVSGSVVDPTGAAVPNAVVKLVSGTTTRVTNSDDDGKFAFYDVPPGPFNITVVLKGFSDAKTNGTFVSGNAVILPPITMQMAEVDVSVNALTQKQLADLQVHAEEQQRVLGVLPNFFVAYDPHSVPLTPKQKFSLVFASFRDPVNIGIAAAYAGVQQANNDLSGYGPGPGGYATRFAANYGNLVVGTTLGGGVFPVLFHQDPRYFYKGTGSFRSRLLYSLSSAVICRGDNGKRQPAYASVLGDFSAGAISNAYYPATDRNGVGLTVANGFIAVGSDAIGNVFQEFVVRHFMPKSRRGVINAVTTSSQQH